MKIVIVGTSHRLQFADASNCTQLQIADYTKFITALCKTHNIKHIAEEASTDVLPHFSVEATLASNIATALGISHDYVDMSREERQKLSFDDSALGEATRELYQNTEMQHMRDVLNTIISDPIRERVWLARILAKRIEGVRIFV